MKPQILITDDLFIFPEHEAKLRAAGFGVTRLHKPKATEAELIKAIQGKAGYILGGVESVTDEVIKAAKDLKVIAFTGADWAALIPGHQTATKQGITITNTPGNTTFAVAEFTLTLMLMMLRHVMEIGWPGDKTFLTTQSITEVKIGIVGLGRIGTEVARMLRALGATNLYYWSRTRRPRVEAELGLTYLELKPLFKTCDVITNHLSSQAGQMINKNLMSQCKPGVLFINTGGSGNFDLDALYTQITTKDARAAFDVHGGVKQGGFPKLPLASWYCTNEGAAYNTRSTLQMASDMAVQSVINVLKTGTDQYVVN